MKHLKLFEAFDEWTEDRMAWTKYFDILSIKYSVGGDDFRLIEPGHPEFDDCVQDCVESEWRKDEIEIYSVRRKEDGEIFTLGQPVFNVSLDIKNFGIADKFWPSFSQMRVDIGNGGFPLNHKFFMSSTILDLKKRGLNKYYAMDINESKKIDIGDWLDLIKKYPSTTPSKYEFDKFKSLADQYNVSCQFDEKNMANTRSISIMTPENHIVIWKLEDEYWTVYVSRKPNKSMTGVAAESHYMCDGFDETIELIKSLLEE